MSKNEIKGKVKKSPWRLLVNEKKKLRVGWMILLGLLAYFAAYYGVLWVSSMVFGALFEAWGLTNDNLAYAPQWARWVVSLHTDICYMLTYAASAFAAMLVSRKWGKGEKGKTWIAFLCGILSALLLTVFSFVFDSMRLETPLNEPMISINVFTALPVLLFGVFSSEVLSKRLLFSPLRERFGRRWGYAAACLMAVLLNGNGRNLFGILSSVAMAIAGCAVYERGGLLAATALSAGWTAWTAWLFAWPNVSSACVYQMYVVSDTWLTGGSAGASGGFGSFLLWGGIAAVLLKQEILSAGKQLREKVKSRKKDAPTRASKK